jgi:hypothetical protein
MNHPGILTETSNKEAEATSNIYIYSEHDDRRDIA